MTLASYVAHALLAVTYSLAYALCYVYFLHKEFGYANYNLVTRGGVFLALSVFICVVPILCYRGMRALSSAFSVVVYLLLYIPIVLTFALASSRSLEAIFLVQATFMICMCALFLADTLQVKNPFDLHVGVNLMRWVVGLTLVATLYVIFVYRGGLRLVAFADVYTQRSATAALSTGLGVRYVSTWLFSVLSPLCLAYGMVARRYRYFVVGAIGCVTLYMATADKTSVLLPVIVAGCYALVSGDRLKSIYLVAASVLSITFVALLAVAPRPGSLTYWLTSILMQRTVGTGGLLTMKYYEFFSFHPHTLYTHIGLVDAISGAYPYGRVQVGQAVGQYYFSSEMNANANFWAMDGIAAIGLIGVPLITIVCVLVFVGMNAVTRGYNRIFVLLCFIPFVLALLNRGLLSSLWSGGGFFLILFFLFNNGNAEVIADPIRKTEVIGGSHRAAGLLSHT